MGQAQLTKLELEIMGQAQDDLISVMQYSIEALQKEVKRLKDQNEFLEAKLEVAKDYAFNKNNN